MTHRSSRALARAYTIVEITIAFAIAVVMIGFLLNLYTKGSKASQKGVWRTTTSQSLRLGLWRLKEAVEASSYPVYVDNETVREEATDAYGIRLLSAGTAAVNGGIRTVTFNSAGNVFQFYACRPLEGATVGTLAEAAARPGTAVRYTVSLQNYNDNPYAKLMLVWQLAEGTITGTSTTQPTFNVTNTRPVERLCTDVTSMEISMPNQSSPISVPTTSGALVIGLKVGVRDPVDGRMTLEEPMQVKANVKLCYP